MIVINHIAEDNVKFTGKYITAKFPDNTIDQIKLAFSHFQGNQNRARQNREETDIYLFGLKFFWRLGKFGPK